MGTELIYKRQLVSIGVPVVSFKDPGAPSFYSLQDKQRFFRPLTKERNSHVNQIILHHDGTADSRGCFRVLAQRSLSTHLMIDGDGTVYQPLDLSDMAYHAGDYNRHSVGIDLNNPVIPNRVKDPSIRGIFTGRINGGRKTSLGYTDAQYDSLIAVVDGLRRIFPKIVTKAPIADDGKVVRTKLREAGFPGVVGHMHVSANKWDPGPGFDWERLLIGIRGNSVFFPVTLPGTRNLAQVPKKTALKAAEPYFRDTELGTGGFFPVGVNQAWHTGIHLNVKVGTPVVAPADGLIMAARNVEPGPLGSPNFVLIKHKLKVGTAFRTFFSVISHLRKETLGPNSKIGWIRRFALDPDAPETLPDDDEATNLPAAPGHIALDVGRVALGAIEVKAGEIIGYSDQFSGNVTDPKLEPLVDIAIISQGPIFPNADTTFEHIDQDPDPGLLCNARAIWKRVTKRPEELRGLVEGAYPISPAEMRAFYADEQGARALRWAAPRHVTEYFAGANFADLLGRGLDFEWHARTLAARHIARVRPFLWWDKAVGVHTNLPGDGVVWTYHPIALLSVIAMGEARRAFKTDAFQKGYAGDELRTQRQRDAALEKEYGLHEAGQTSAREDSQSIDLDDIEIDDDPENAGWMRWEQGEWEPDD